MPRVQPKTISRKERTKLLDEFWTMIALLNSREEVKNFFKDLLSETEAIMLARRIRIAMLLLGGKSYETIRIQLKTSYATISGVHRWLQGGFGGYENFLPRLEKELHRRTKVEENRTESKTPYTFAWLKRKYPMHFLLFNLMDSMHLRTPKKLRTK